MAGIGVVGLLGVPSSSLNGRAAIPGVTVEYKRCRFGLVTGTSNVDTLTVYYVGKDGGRRAVYDIDPTTNTSRKGGPTNGDTLLVTYNADEDRTQLQLREPKEGALACIVAEASGARTVQVNSAAGCVPAGFNSPPSASFTAETSDTAATSAGIEVDVSEQVTFTSTATDPDLPVERITYEWDLDGDGVYESSGQRVVTTYEAATSLTVSHRVADDFGQQAAASAPISVVAVATYPAQQVAFLQGPGTVSGAEFGTSVAIDGDTALVGADRAPGSTSAFGPRSFKGEAYVFERSEGTWGFSTALTASDTAEGDHFGLSVALDGDTAVVGAPLHDARGISNSGAAYVFSRSGGTWSLEQKLVAGDGMYFGRFGNVVDVSGTTILVGHSKAVYVFTRSDSGWVQEAKLTTTDTTFDDYFGKAVAVDGDLAFVGAPTGVSTTVNGAVYVFERTGSGWMQRARLRPDTRTRGNFGESIALSGDLALIGAGTDTDDGTNSGAVYAFALQNQVWTNVQKFNASGTGSYDNFGRSVAVDGGVALVGAPGDDMKGSGAGASYVFTEADGVWSEQTKLVFTGGQPSDRLGDTNGVGLSGGAAIVGIRLDDSGYTNRGSALIFE